MKKDERACNRSMFTNLKPEEKDGQEFATIVSMPFKHQFWICMDVRDVSQSFITIKIRYFLDWFWYNQELLN